MSLPFHLGLRADRHVVSVIKQNGRTRRQLGVAYPLESDPRRRILKQWGIDDASPRRADPDTIDLPLSPRAQAILSYQVNPALRHELNTGMEPLLQSRRDGQPGVHGRTHLGESHSLISSTPHGFRALREPARPGGTVPFRGRR